jgi:CRISPR/Cas system-associated exonuclease Cas4 (RecB family)
MPTTIQHPDISVDSVQQYENKENSKLEISASKIGKIIKTDQCPRYSRLRVDKKMEDTVLKGNRGWDDFSPLNRILSTEGQRFENSVYKRFKKNAGKVIKNYRPKKDTEDDELVISENQINQINEKIISGLLEAVDGEPGDDPVVMLQTPFSGIIEEFSVVGYSDLIIVWPEPNDGITIRVIDIKASWEEKTDHQLQTATYTTLLRQVIEEYETRNNTTLNYTMEGGVLTRESEYTYPDKYELPQFELPTREKNVKRMLSEDGEIYKSLMGADEFEDVEYQLDTICQSCEYRNICYADSYDRADIALLGISRGQQKALREQGIETIHDLADITPEQNKDPTSFEQKDVKSVHKETVSNLPTEIQLQISELSQHAKEFLPFIDPDNSNASGDTYYMSTKTGAGRTNLPDDDPPPHLTDKLSYTPQKLIKVYMNVQKDYVTDRTVLLSATVDSTAFTGDPIQVSQSISDIPVNSDFEFKFDELDEYEHTMLQEFIDNLYGAIDTVACAIGEYPKAATHFYFYTQKELDALTESLKRYENSGDITDTFRDVLSLREGPEQQMYSIVKNEITQHMYLDQMPTSLLTLKDRFWPQDDTYKVEYEEGIITDSNGNEVNLRSAFRNKLFNYSEQYEYRAVKNDDGKTTAYVKFRESDTTDDDESMPFAPDHRGAEIPLEYIWGSQEINILSPDWVAHVKSTESSLLSEDELVAEEMEKNIAQLSGVSEVFRHIDPERQNRTQLEHIEELSMLLTKYLRQLERGIMYKNVGVSKEPIDVSSLQEFEIERDLSESLQDYVDMEFTAGKNEALGHYKLPLRQRIQTGKSIPVRVTDVDETPNGGLHIKGDLAYEDVGFDNPQLMAASCRESGPGLGSSGSWMVASRIEPDGDTFIEQNGGEPDKILHEPGVTLQYVDTDTLSIEFTHSPYSSSSDRYDMWNRSFVGSMEENETYFDEFIQPGMYLVLDEQVSAYTAETTVKSLQNTENNTTYNLLTDLHTESADLDADIVSQKYTREFLRWLRKEDDDIVVTPNRKQRQFVKNIDSKIQLLQGPPGTGKTSGAIATALGARLFAASKEDETLRGLVTGASNKSIDEVAKKLSEFTDIYNTHGPGNELQNTNIVRITGSPPDSSERPSNVKYLHYNNKEDIAEITVLLDRLDNGGVGAEAPETRQDTLIDDEDEPPQHTIVLITPTTLYGLLKRYTEETSAEEVYEAGPTLFDVFCVDEASMFRLPQFVLTGAFVAENGQWLIAGDHRQMPPVQKYDWEDETRRPVEEYLPYLSTLNYMRYLRGDDLSEFIDEELLDDQPENSNIARTGLEVTYRCHTAIAEFLQEWVYQKDNINYRSDQTETIPEVTTGTEGLQQALDEDSPLTVIIHDDDKSKQFNPAEAEISAALGRSLPESESQGIVTPHNSQKGFLKSIYPDASVDTVERFQGGQRDVMMVSATVSDPNFLSSESDFIFDPRRLNVAISRMKKKLIVIAPRSLFNYVPEEVDLYQKAVIWTGLYEQVNGNESPAWKGTLDEFAENPTHNGDTMVSVYHAE